MKPSNRIIASCRIKNKAVFLNGKLVFAAANTNFTDFSKSVYSAFKFNYLKYFKMDQLSKLGFMAAELLMHDFSPKNQVKGEDIAVLMANAASSIDTDRKHNDSIQNRHNYFPSPSVFVYTLSNILVGEICIRHQFKGENAFYISKNFDANLICNQANQMLNEESAKAVLMGWVDYEDDQEDALLCWVMPSHEEQLLELNTANYTNLYTSTNS